MKTKLPIFVAVVLSLMLLSSVLMGIYWLPGVFAYLSAFLSPDGFVLFKILFYLIGFSFCAILLSASVFPKAMIEDRIFTQKTAKRIRGIALAILADCLLLSVLAVWSIAAGERLLAPALLFVAFIGIMVASAVFILSDYIARAAVLKEEADCTL